MLKRVKKSLGISYKYRSGEVALMMGRGVLALLEFGGIWIQLLNPVKQKAKTEQYCKSDD
jgi:hypothetical protein